MTGPTTSPLYTTSLKFPFNSEAQVDPDTLKLTETPQQNPKSRSPNSGPSYSYPESQVAQNNRPLFHKVAHNISKVAPNSRPQRLSRYGVEPQVDLLFGSAQPPRALGTGSRPHLSRTVVSFRVGLENQWLVIMGYFQSEGLLGEGSFQGSFKGHSFGKPKAYNYGLLRCIVACYFGLLGVPGGL